jgi:ABC-type branched-subunit amino acid transport system ATPase component
VALDSVELTAAAGELVGLVGANGAGKSTLLDVVSGFVRPATGAVVLDGRPISSLSPAARARTGIGRVMQDARLFDDLTVAEAVLLAAGATGPGRGRKIRGWTGDQRRQTDATIALLGLESWAAVPCQHLSTGTRRVAELACAIVGGPSLLLLDEPTAGLAQPEAEAFGPLIGLLREELGLTVVLVEHDVALVRSLADRMVCLGAGRVLADGPPDDVVTDPKVVASFLGADPP